MAEASDFEQAWLVKFSSCLDETVGEETRKHIVQGSAGLSMNSSRQEVIEWTAGAMQRLETSSNEDMHPTRPTRL